MWDYETWFTGMLCVLSGVCKKWPLWTKFLGPNRSIYKFSSIFWKSFHWIQSKLDLWVHWNYFCRCGKDWPQRIEFVDHCAPPNRSKFKLALYIFRLWNSPWSVPMAVYRLLPSLSSCANRKPTATCWDNGMGPVQIWTKQNDHLDCFTVRLFHDMTMLWHMLI